VLGLGENVPINTGNGAEGLLVLHDGEWVVLRVPYPLGFYTKWLDGRIDDPDAGWKGRGLWATISTRVPHAPRNGRASTSWIRWRHENSDAQHERMADHDRSQLRVCERDETSPAAAPAMGEETVVVPVRGISERVATFVPRGELVLEAGECSVWPLPREGVRRLNMVYPARAGGRTAITITVDAAGTVLR
jgi:hypothetical protein